MPKEQSPTASSVTRYQNAALNYYLQLTGSPYLHYGYWEPLPTSAEERSLFRLRIAQEAYSKKLLSFLPPNTESLLDVGCGIGGNAVFLLNQGLKVDGLAPDPFQQEKFLEKTQGKAKFYLSKFEDFQATQAYDVVMLSESSQYMAAVDIAKSAAAALKPDGYLLLADMLRTDANYTQGIFSNCHDVEELAEALSQAGFELIKREDISQQVAPTLDLAVEVFRQYGLSTGEYIANVLKIAVPPLYYLLNWIYERWFKKVIIEGLNASQIFDKHLCYEIQLWQFMGTKSA
ncbi:MAG: methyltransferase domain-containing protein [Snowella sp.]|nr:methyltransferase domain-containing protein [Snowella sp.]